VLPQLRLPPDWFALWGPQGLPAPIVERTHKEMLAAINTPDMQEWLQVNGIHPMGSTPAQLAQMLDEGVATYVQLMAGIDLQAQ
jgi:tripartite-type tricarboxylate transporter receptor subunit TctC